MNEEISIQENNSGLSGKENELFSDVCRIIDGARDRVATHLNTELCLTNWYIGHRIKEDVLYNQRAEYGKQVVKNLSKLLTGRYGSGWKYEKLKQCIRVAYAFSEEEIRYALRTQLTWTHLRSLTGVKEPLARRFYVEMCRIEHWDTRTLDEKIDGQLFERTAISRKPEDVIKRELEQVKMTNQLLPDLVSGAVTFLICWDYRMLSRRKILRMQYFRRFSPSSRNLVLTLPFWIDRRGLR